MAIIKMKKLSLVCLRADRDKLMDLAQGMQCIEVVEQPFEEEEGLITLEMREDFAALAERIALLTGALASLSRYAPVKKGMFAQRDQVDAEGIAAALTAQEATVEICRDVMRKEAEISDIRQRRTRMEAQVEQLRPLSGCDLPLEQLKDTARAQVTLGSLHPSKLEDLMHKASEAELLQLIELGRTPDAVYVLAIAHKSFAEEASALLTSAGLTKLTLHYQGTATQVIAGFEADIEKDEKAREALIKDIEGHADDRLAIQTLIDLSNLEKERLEASSLLSVTREALHMAAWVPADKEQALRTAIEKISPCVAMEFADPEEGDNVPTYVENNKFLTPYEAVTNMFSTPSQNDIDPSPKLMPFFVVFFGMMVSDAGYGILLSIGGFVGAYVLKMRGMMGQIAKILIVGGLLTTFWGALFGSWFGIEGIDAPLFVPMNEPMAMLGLCFSLGLIHVMYGMVLRMIMAFRSGDWQTAVFDQIGWMAIILGLIALAIGGALGINPLFMGGSVVAIVGVLMVLLFAGRDKPFGIGRIVSGLGSLYGITSYLSDVLSYARLFAMGLATGVICMVFNTIAGLLLSSPIGFIFGIAVLLVGHIFNLAINALGAYVHSCRLQYIEFFGKFFEGGGRAFKPLMRNTRHVDFKS